MVQGNTPQNTDTFKKETLYIAVLIAFVAGFLSGIVFSVYKSGTIPQQRHVSQQQSPPGNQGISPDEAARILALEKEIAINPNNVQAITNLAHLYFDSHQYQKAINMYQKSLAIEPGNPNVWTDLGVMYRRSNQPQQAINAFDQAIKNDPKHEISRFNKGIVLLHDLQDKQGAIAAWKGLLAINPNARASNGRPIQDFIDEAQNQ